MSWALLDFGAMLLARLPKAPLAALVRAVYPRVEPELGRLGEYVPRGGTAIDIGGWFGPWTTRLARYADHVVTIEADPRLAGLLRRAFPGVRVVQAAASDAPGEIELWAREGGALAGTSSVEHAQGTSRTVPKITIDGLALADVRFIKLDIEGHELPALRGAAGTIRRDRPLIILELEERHQPIAPVVELLGSWGYQGHVLLGTAWRPLRGFDLAAHQRAAIRRVDQSFLRRLAWPYPRYVNSVLFRPG